jgi:hypothetical protein
VIVGTEKFVKQESLDDIRLNRTPVNPSGDVFTSEIAKLLYLFQKILVWPAEVVSDKYPPIGNLLVTHMPRKRDPSMQSPSAIFYIGVTIGLI